MIFVDATVPLGLVGDDPQLKARAERALERAIDAGDRLVTDAEVLLEILERCTAADCLEAVEPAMDVLLGVVDEVLAVDEIDVRRAKEMVYGPEGLGARCCLHLAVMERHEVARLMSFDPSFDRDPDIDRA